MTEPTPSPKRDPLPDEAQVNPLDYFLPGKVLPSPPDPRDYQAEQHSPFLAMVAAPAARPRRYEMPDKWGLINQGPRGACAAFEACGQARTAFARVGVDFDPAEEAQYALAREAEGWLGQDSGSYPRDNQKVMADIGIANEADAVYLSHDLSWVPDQPLRAVMSGRRIDTYFVAGTDEAIKQTIYGTGNDDGFDVSACFVLQKNFGYDANFNLPMPAGGEWGGHAMRIRGYDDDRVMPDGTTGAYKLKNQWGDWGDPDGCAWMSYAACHLDPNAGGLWYGDTWVSVVNGVVPVPVPVPVPPDPTPVPDTDGYTRALAVASDTLRVIQADAAAYPRSTKRRYLYQGANAIVSKLMAER